MTEPGELDARLARFRAELSGALADSREQAGRVTRGLAEQRRRMAEFGRDFAERTGELAERLRGIAERARRRRFGPPPQHREPGREYFSFTQLTAEETQPEEIRPSAEDGRTRRSWRP